MTEAAESLVSAAPEIERLSEKATPGKWERDFDTRYERHDREHHKEHFLTAEKRRCIAVASNHDAEMLTPDDEGRLEDLQARADLDFIAALVNAWRSRMIAARPVAAPLREDDLCAIESLARGGLASNDPEHTCPAVDSCIAILKAAKGKLDGPPLREALAELVRLQDVRRRMDVVLDENDETDEEWIRLRAEYDRDCPAAWDRARALLEETK